MTKYRRNRNRRFTPMKATHIGVHRRFQTLNRALCASSAGSEGKSQTELNLPRGRDRRGDAAGGGVDYPPLLENNPVRGVGNCEVRMVEGVEDLGPEAD